MASWLNYVITDMWNDSSIPDTENYFWLKGGPWRTWTATAIYLYIVLKIGPDFMRHRKPYGLRNTVRLYNLLLVIVNTYMFAICMQEFNFGFETWGCKSASNVARSDKILEYGHIVFYVRYLEFFDTFFLILKKKESQLSFLHIFHHAIVPTLMYIGLKFNPVPFNAMLPITNLFVHIIMYAYYGLSTCGPAIQKWLWWKRYLTTLQISQFVLLIIHSIHPIFLYGFVTNCRFPSSLIIINTLIGIVFLTLFVSFYRRTYNAKRSQSVSKAGIGNGIVADSIGRESKREKSD